MKKMKVTTMLAGVAILATAGIAQAVPQELNIYGASAQYLFWNANAKNFAINSLGCPAVNVTDPVNNGGKHGFVHATGCSSTLIPVNSDTGTRDIDIRYSGIASAEGPLSVGKLAPIDSALLTSSAGPCNQANGERAMYASSSTTVCKQVHLGTSDVAGETLVQSSYGHKQGPLGGQADFTATLSGIDTTALGLSPDNTVVVPFGFFVNNAVKARKCTAGLVGNYCTANSQCDTVVNGVTIPGTCDTNYTTIDNISRSQAAMIFSGQAANWSDLGDYFEAKPIVACLRHAGSGTHAAFDFTVMNAGSTGWGAATVQAEYTDPAGPNIYFNQSSGDLIKCVNGNDTVNTTGSLVGAIGYADADQSVGKPNESQNVSPVKYNGVWPTRTTIRNGLYEFYTAAWLYTNPANSSTVNNLAASLITFAKDPANIPSSKVNFWASMDEMKYMRSNDMSYPGYQGAVAPMLP